MFRHLVAPVLVVLTACVPLASAGEPTRRLQALFEDANRILVASDGDTALEDRVGAIRALVDDAFDAREAAALALGREWDGRTPAERDEFVRLYADLVGRAYLAWIGSHARVHGDGVRIAFESESVQGERATVVTTLHTRGAGEMPIEYRLRRRDGRWAVHDVVVDGLSLAESYRAQFHRVLQGGSYAELVARMHDKASPSTLIAIARSKTLRPAAIAPAAAKPSFGAAAASAPVATPPPVHVASAAPVSDAPPVGRRVPVPDPPAAAERRVPVVPAAQSADAVTALSSPRPGPTPVVVSPPRAVAVVPAVQKWFWVQVGAFRDTDAASRLVERLRRHPVMVATGGQRATPLARVLVGPFAHRAAATSTLRELAARGYRAFIAFE